MPNVINNDDMALALLIQAECDPLGIYLPNAKQRAFHELTSHIAAFIAGNGTGKTHSGARDFCMALKGRHWVTGKYPLPPLDGRIGATKTALEGISETSKAIIPTLLKLLKDDLTPGYPQKAGKTYFSQWKLKNGSSFDILTYDQADNKWESVTKDIIWFDEPPSRQVFVASTSRMRSGMGGRIIITMTPLMSAAWMYELFANEESKDVNYVRSSIWDNCSCLRPEEHGDYCHCNGGYVHKAAIDKIIANWIELGGDIELDARERGEFIIMRDIVFPMFNPDVHIIEPLTPEDVKQRQLQLYSVIDPHSKRPPAWGLYGYDADNRLYVIDEWPNFFEGHYKNRLYDKIAANDFDYEQTIKILADIEAKYDRPVIQRFIDPRYAKNRTPNTNRTVLDELHSVARKLHEEGKIEKPMRWHRPLVGGDAGEGEINSGLGIIRQMLSYDDSRQIDSVNSPHLLVGGNCANHVRMLQYLKYQSLRPSKSDIMLPTDVLEPRFKDFSDIVRYLIKTVSGWKTRLALTDDLRTYKYTPVNVMTGY